MISTKKRRLMAFFWSTVWYMDAPSLAVKPMRANKNQQSHQFAPVFVQQLPEKVHEQLFQGRIGKGLSKQWILIISLLALPMVSFGNQANWQLYTRSQPYDYLSQAIPIIYQPLPKATKKWQLCTLYPHLKDPYWLGVNYGMVSEAKRLGVGLTVLEAGGYPQIANQRQQLNQCASDGADIILLGTVTFHELTPTILALNERSIPITGLVNDIANEGIGAKTGVSWYEMGYSIGHYLVEAAKATDQPVKVAWFPGPKGAGWVKFLDNGFQDAISNSNIAIVITKWGDTGKEVQRNLVQEVMDSGISVDYIVGTALTADAAVSELIHRGLQNKIGILSTYMTQNVLRGIKRGHIIAAPNDSPIVQGKIAVEQAVRLLENKLSYKHLSPAIEIIDSQKMSTFDSTTVLTPPSYWYCS